MRKDAVRFLDMGMVSYLHSQTIYHAIAHAMVEGSPDTISLMSPRDPYVCVGYHQEVEKEVDVEYCWANGLPIIRREVGGGAVYLDRGQLFFQCIFHRAHAPVRIEDIYSYFLRAPVETYRAIGIEAHHRPINDIQVEGRKICGTGAAQIGQAVVLVGNLIFDFNYQLMARVLKVPSEKFRDKLYSTLQEYLTTIKRELGQEPPRTEVKGILIEKFAQVLGREIEPGELSPAEEEARAELDARFLSPQWTFQKGGMPKEGVKIAEGIRVLENSHKAPGGLIRATLLLKEQVIDEVTLSGDFFFYPAKKLAGLEEALRGERLEEGILEEKVKRFLEVHSVQVPGVAAEDFVQALVGSVRPPTA